MWTSSNRLFPKWFTFSPEFDKSLTLFYDGRDWNKSIDMCQISKNISKIINHGPSFDERFSQNAYEKGENVYISLSTLLNAKTAEKNIIFLLTLPKYHNCS